MSFTDFKEVSINNPGTASFYGSDDLNEIMRIFNAKVVSNRQVKIKNPWQFQDNYDVVAAAAVPANPGANTKRFYVDPLDLHFKMKSTGGSVLDFDVLGAGAQGEANLGGNVGTAGVGPFKDKLGVTLQFKKINAGSSKITITDDTTNDEIDIDAVEANLLLQNIGGLLTVSKGGTGIGTHTINSLLKGNGASALTNIAPGTDGHLLTMVAGAPAWAAASASQDVKTAIFEAGTQIGAVGRRLNFPEPDDFTITEDSVNDRFDIRKIRRYQLAAMWQNTIPPVAKGDVGTTYVDWLASQGDGAGTDLDGTGVNEWYLYVSWDKGGGLGTHSCRIINHGNTDVLAEIANCVNGRNISSGTLPAFYQDQIRGIKVQIKSTNSTDDPKPLAVSLFVK